MISIRSLALLGLAGLLVPAVASMAAVAEDTKVTVEGVHLCCGACVKAVDEAAAKVEGATVTCDRDASSVAIVAPTVEAAQKALDAITDAGYHGTPDSDIVKVKEDSDAPEGKVDSLTLTGAHNCCRGCAVAISGALEDVEGIAEVKAEPRTTIVTLTGDFDARLAIKALNEAGFHVKVKKD
jgi:copper chaperone CopZ